MKRLVFLWLFLSALPISAPAATMPESFVHPQPAPPSPWTGSAVASAAFPFSFWKSGAVSPTPTATPSATPSATPTSFVATWASNGDTNGVFYYAGKNYTSGGTWTNPHTAGKITVSSSSIQNGTMADVVDRAPDDVYTDAFANSFYTFDLGSGRALAVTDWTYQSRDTQASQSTPTAMTLQGSNNGSSWTTIDARTGINITAISTWLHFTTTSASYRYFKLIQTAPNQTGSEYFTIGELELYGTLDY